MDRVGKRGSGLDLLHFDMDIFGGGSTTSDEEHGPQVPLLELLEQRAGQLQEVGPLLFQPS